MLAAARADPERIPVLAYGSNVCPSKITWLRETLGLSGPVIAARAECRDLAAVWAAALRPRDDQRPATLASAPGVTEWHAVWFATPEQVDALDVCEARGKAYELARLHSGRITLEDGSALDEVYAYVGLDGGNMPLLVHGDPVRTADLDQYGAARLTGEAAGTHGLDVTVVPEGAPVSR
ncbi:gamma-glutamylcyclotransferase [Prauserella aidingensis]|uniref:gamma-glutamylcyclotransferase n=1 Tax=Prauserella aidingensis TaxID=387890 RepID=UPI0020A41F46|nr:gamma-glutamylcyclotransferase [Prauserella aidingensis]